MECSSGSCILKDGLYVTELFIEKHPSNFKIAHREVSYEESEVRRSAARFPAWG